MVGHQPQSSVRSWCHDRAPGGDGVHCARETCPAKARGRSSASRMANGETKHKQRHRHRNRQDGRITSAHAWPIKVLHAWAAKAQHKDAWAPMDQAGLEAAQAAVT